MNEKEIAENKVIPYLERLGWPKQLITQYGKVPVQMGTEVKWADIVIMFVDENDLALPYTVIEVKQKLDDVNSTVAQTESYSKFLDTVYFAATDGANYAFYHRKPTGGYIRINNIPIPDKEHLTVTRNTKFRPGVILCASVMTTVRETIDQYGRDFLGKVDEYFDLLTSREHFLGSKRYSLRNDAIWHYLSIKKTYVLVHEKSDSLRPAEFKEFFKAAIMSEKRPNVDRVFNEADKNFNKIRAFLRFIKDFKGDPEENLNRLFDTNDELHISGIGPFVVSQFLAGAHPTEYAIVQDRMVNTMKGFGLIDAKVKSDTAKGYLYINEICKKLYREVFKKKIEESRNKLDFKIDEDFGLVLIHEFFWEYEEFSFFSKRKLEKSSSSEFERQRHNMVDELGRFF